ncbi:MAG TPA: TIGR03546 family protein [Gemmatimonadales bacterium]|nr:TIGR03546 family protein [Gemmatimonadales bacterium]
MLTLLKLLQSLFKTLHSEGTPGQVAAGIMLGAGIGLTPLMSAHNLVLFAAIVLLNVSFGGGMLGMALFTPVGFLLDPLFDKVGLALLKAAPLQGLWTDWYNIPLVPYTNFNNSVTLGSFVVWLVLTIPLYFLGKVAIARYRATYGARVMNSKLMKGIKASRVYNVYSWFRPE